VQAHEADKLLAAARAGDLDRLGDERAGDRDDARSRFDAGMRGLEKLGLALDPDDASEVEWLRDQLR